MPGTNMTNLASETFGQARQGSVAAIIQVLNERLADVGIRTRAVVADGMLQLLCEAVAPEQLEKQTVVEKVRSVLETISPQHIKKVKINSRIVKEDQLLWLEEINRDPENALLWSEIITLKRPFFVQRWIRDRHLKPAGPIFKDITEPEPYRASFTTQIIGASGLAFLLLVAGWLFREDLGMRPVAEAPSPEPGALSATAPISSAAERAEEQAGEQAADTTPTRPPAANPAANNAANSAANPTANNAATSANSSSNSSATSAASAKPTSAPATAQTAPANSGAIADAFAEAVRIAEQAAVDGQSATTTAAWLEIAARWQRASDLMGQIPQGNEQYTVAQDRLKTYQTNSQSALQKANAAKAQ
jgi:hypothetical protein